MPAKAGMTLSEIMHPEDRARVEAAVRASVEGPGRFEVEYRTVRPDDGRVVWTRMSAIRVTDPDGASGGAVGIVEDISGRKVEESQRLTLMAELDHRVKNVLAAVQALAFQTAKRSARLVERTSRSSI
jgi:two-component sensor histidine kinase